MDRLLAAGIEFHAQIVLMPDENDGDALRETLDLALQNALARVRGDVERSVNGLVAEAVSRELERLDLDKIARR